MLRPALQVWLYVTFMEPLQPMGGFSTLVALVESYQSDKIDLQQVPYYSATSTIRSVLEIICIPTCPRVTRGAVYSHSLFLPVRDVDRYCIEQALIVPQFPLAIVPQQPCVAFLPTHSHESSLEGRLHRLPESQGQMRRDQAPLRHLQAAATRLPRLQIIIVALVSPVAINIYHHLQGSSQSTSASSTRERPEATTITEYCLPGRGCPARGRAPGG